MTDIMMCISIALVSHEYGYTVEVDIDRDEDLEATWRDILELLQETDLTALPTDRLDTSSGEEETLLSVELEWECSHPSKEVEVGGIVFLSDDTSVAVETCMSSVLGVLAIRPDLDSRVPMGGGSFWVSHIDRVD